MANINKPEHFVMTVKSNLVKSSTVRYNIKSLLVAQATALLTGLVLLCSASIPVLAKNLSVQLESIPMGKATFYMVIFERGVSANSEVNSEAGHQPKITL